MQKSNIFATFAILISLAVLGFLLYNFNFESGPQLSFSPQQEITDIKQSSLWNSQFTDIRTNQQFRLSDFQDKIIIVESSSPSCPQCVKQQREILSLTNDLSNSIIVVSFITDLNYDAERIRQYAENNNFNWYFVSSERTNNILKNDFSESFLIFSANPIKLICQDGKIINFESGIKFFSEIKDKINEC